MLKIYKLLPNFIQNFLITVYNFWQYNQRHRSVYFEYIKFIQKMEFKSLKEIENIQNQLFIKFLNFVKDNSPYYKEILGNQDLSIGKKILSKIPIISKEEFIENIPKIVTGNKRKLIASKTGGTTGASIEVFYQDADFQRRFAFLDSFRGRFGYKFGDKTAWFSGKDLLSKKNILNNIFWKYDFYNKIRFYSTFHISDNSAKYYLEDIKKFKPLFIVGFPSSIVELARVGLSQNFNLGYSPKAIFPTAESRIQIEVDDMECFFGCKVFDQYASSEGACFITECESGNMHFEPLSGIIEVVDQNDQPSKEGRMLITSFETRGTPLLRYDIGDRMKWSDKISCDCGRNTPIVEEIQGRLNDFLYSKETGKCNLGNVSNCVKNVKGIKKFQVIQDELNSIYIKVAKSEAYTLKDENAFINEFRARLGNSINISIEYVADIPREASGKYRIVKNNLKILNE